MALKYTVELSNRSFTKLEELQMEAKNLRWSYARIGGCGDFSFSLPRRFTEEKHIGGDFNVKIYKQENDGSLTLFYQGMVLQKSPSVRGESEEVSVRGHGYVNQLKRIQLDQNYSATEVSAIVTDLLDNYITPNTDITYSAGDIEATGYTPDSLKFDGDCFTAIETLADIVGSREWGVDRNRKFFFKARSETVSHSFPLGGKIKNYSSDDDFSAVINRVIVRGGDNGGTQYISDPAGDDYNNLASQLKYGRRDHIIYNSSVTTDAVSAQLAQATLAEFSVIVRRGRCELVDYTDLIESTTPLGLAQVIVSNAATYGTKKYGTGLYSGRIKQQINRINYEIDQGGNISVKIELGRLRPSIAENISQLEHKLEQVSTVNI